jgi:putative thioredoxin
LTLAPILESLAGEYAGRFLLAKANVELAQQQAMEFRVRGVPAVFAVVAGEVVDFFEGLLPPEQVRRWIDRVLLAADLTKTKELEATQPDEAERRYRDLLAASPDDAAAAIGLARALLAQDRRDECRAAIETLEKRGFLEPEGEKVKAALRLAAGRDANLDELRAAAEAEPGNLQLRHKLAEGLAATGEQQQALDILLELVQKDRGDVREQARQTMVDIFRTLPDDSELTGQYRRKLASALY